MAYDSNISPGNPPLKWNRLKSALDKINENFSIIGSSIATYRPQTVANIDKSNPVKITFTDAHQMQSGWQVLVKDTGVSQLDGNEYYITIDSDNEILLYSDSALTTPVDGTSNDVYPSGGGTVTAYSPFASLDFENFHSSIIPADTGTFNLGTSSNQWKEIHVESQSDTPGSENNGLWLGEAKIQGVGTVVDLPLNSTVNGELIINPAYTFFSSVEIDEGDRIVADEFVDTIRLESGNAIQLTADSGAESITITNTGVTQLTAGTAISVSSATGAITVTNTGITSITNGSTLPSGLTAGSGIAVDSSTGDVVLTNTGVIEVQQGFGITVFTDTATGIATITNNAPAVPTFQTFSVQGQPGVSPDNTSDTIEFVEGYGITMTTDATNDKITFAVDNKIDIVGSVFADDSTLLVDGITGRIVADVYANVFGNVTGNVTGDITGDLVGDTTGYHTGDVKGSVFADDSTKIVDAVEAKVYAEFFGNITGNVTGNVTGDLTGDVSGNVVGNVTGNVTGNITGYQTGDMTGSVFGDDSTLLVDAVESKIVGPILSDNIRGSFIGTVFADDSSLIINELGEITYTATTPADWNGAAPTTIGEAIDRLATLVKTLNGGTGA